MASDRITVCMAFPGDPGRNMTLQWEGPLPRKGEFVQLKGRDLNLRVSSVTWVMEPKPREKTLSRAVMLVVEEVSLQEMPGGS